MKFKGLLKFIFYLTIIIILYYSFTGITRLFQYPGGYGFCDTCQNLYYDLLKASLHNELKLSSASCNDDDTLVVYNFKKEFAVLIWQKKAFSSLNLDSLILKKTKIRNNYFNLPYSEIQIGNHPTLTFKYRFTKDCYRRININIAKEDEITDSINDSFYHSLFFTTSKFELKDGFQNSIAILNFGKNKIDISLNLIKIRKRTFVVLIYPINENTISKDKVLEILNL